MWDRVLYLAQRASSDSQTVHEILASFKGYEKRGGWRWPSDDAPPSLSLSVCFSKTSLQCSPLRNLLCPSSMEKLMRLSTSAHEVLEGQSFGWLSGRTYYHVNTCKPRQMNCIPSKLTLFHIPNHTKAATRLQNSVYLTKSVHVREPYGVRSVTHLTLPETSFHRPVKRLRGNNSISPPVFDL